MRNIIIHKCPTCGKIFSKPKYRKATYCSHRCSLTKARQSRAGKMSKRVWTEEQKKRISAYRVLNWKNQYYEVVNGHKKKRTSGSEIKVE